MCVPHVHGRAEPYKLCIELGKVHRVPSTYLGIPSYLQLPFSLALRLHSGLYEYNEPIAYLATTYST